MIPTEVVEIAAILRSKYPREDISAEAEFDYSISAAWEIYEYIKD